jgi:hypothetical protein
MVSVQEAPTASVEEQPLVSVKAELPVRVAADRVMAAVLLEGLVTVTVWVAVAPTVVENVMDVDEKEMPGVAGRDVAVPPPPQAARNETGKRRRARRKAKDGARSMTADLDSGG